MKLKDLISNCPETFLDVEISGVTDDSRKVAKSNLFVCVKGPVADGHNYAQKAIESGAAVVITERDLKLENQIIVEDTHKALAEVCGNWFGNPQNKLRVIGVTGTNGKTSVSYMLKKIFEHSGYKTGLLGTVQNMIGDEVYPSKNTTPGVFELYSLFAKMVDAGCEYAVMEVSSHALDQRRVEGVHFAAAIFTNLTQDHLDYHGNMENYFEAKKLLFSHSDLAVINFDDEYGKRIIDNSSCRTATYSAVSNESTYTAKCINYRPDGVDYEMVGFGLIGRIKLKTAGKFSVYNSLAAAVCAKELGMPLNEVTDALNSLEGVKGRAEVVPCDRDFTIIIDYAHTPDGLHNILNTFKECPKNRLVVLFGCGGDRDRTKRPKMGTVAARLSDYVIVTSDNPRTEEPKAIIDDILEGMKDIPTPKKVIENRIEAINFAIANAKTGDIIILAGKGHETYQIIGTETIHLDEREIIADALTKC
ncbi:MAG: UDP-N-acetylmuramoyl-L-alanyl-D-glutamate--2,6-diaminopimelate ligase [Clostridia bacterium]|nr:UDP-N-acetylmuramoyl-L-alanyl-D-glutamate--2,6-diaminopimelate ligase [Clostridia bacterium]